MHDKFYTVVSNSVNKKGEKFSTANRNNFVKVVFDENITDNEIQKTLDLAKEYDFEIILQPKMLDDKPTVKSDFMMHVFEKFVKEYKHTRLIPQMHKFIDIE